MQNEEELFLYPVFLCSQKSQSSLQIPSLPLSTTEVGEADKVLREQWQAQGHLFYLV